MNSENSIEVRDVTKQFKIFIDKGRTIKERALFRRRRQYEHRQVLRGVSFDVKKGEAVGLIPRFCGFLRDSYGRRYFRSGRREDFRTPYR